MKKFFAVLLVAMMVLSFAASAEVITYMDHYNEDTKINGVDALVAGAQAKYPDYQYEVSHQGFDSFLESVKTKIAAQDAPDLFQGNVHEYPELIDGGMILDMSDSELIGRLNAAAVAEASKDGKVWAIPTDKEVRCLFVNLDCFEQNGIALPTTRSEFVDACAKLKEAGIQPVGMGLLTGAMTLDSFDFLWHCRLLDAGLNDVQGKIAAGEAKFADYPEYQEALKDFNELFLENSIENELSVDRAEMLVGLANGTIAMVPSGIYSVGDIRSNNPEGNFGILPFPVFDEAEKNGILMSIDDVFMIPSSADGIDGAKAYLDYATTEEGVNAWISNSLMLSTTENINVTTLDPMVKAMQDWIDGGNQLYYRADLTKWEGATLNKMQSLMQSYVALSPEERTDYASAAAWIDGEFEAMM